MLRLIIIAAVVYLLYRILKGLVEKKREVEDSNGGVIDELVQDPQCKVYVPKRTAVKKMVQGRGRYFCSEECAKKFEESSKSGL